VKYLNKMNRPLMFINNSPILVEQLKKEVWSNYKKIISGDFTKWYENLNAIEKEAFRIKFDEIN